MTLRVDGEVEATRGVPMHLTWSLEGLTFWQRWGWLILLILGLLLLLFVIMGFILPHRFRRGLALVFVPEYEDLDEQTPQPIRQWSGTGIGFYRHARAFLHANFRVSGKPRGALAGLFASGSSTRIVPGRGQALYRELLDGDWDPVESGGRTVRPGEVFRVGDRGPYVRIATRG